MTYTPDSPLFGHARASFASSVAFMCARPHGEYTEFDIETIVRAYLERSAGIDATLAIAQLIHETGCLSSWWAARPRRNPAGIGVTGRWSETKPNGAWEKQGGIWVEGLSFASWANDAVPAHIGRLLAYALQDGQGTSPQKRLIDLSLSLRTLPISYRGSAPTLAGLNGRWATGQGYAQAIADVANAITRM